MSGSSTLVQALISDGLLGELHLFVYPITRGTGPRLFPDNPPTKWSLAHSATCDNGVIYVVYHASSCRPGKAQQSPDLATHEAWQE